MNATPAVNTSHPKDHVAGSRTGGQEMAKMLQEMKVGTLTTPSYLPQSLLSSSHRNVILKDLIVHPQVVLPQMLRLLVELQINNLSMTSLKN